jgi:hypothetical protein
MRPNPETLGVKLAQELRWNLEEIGEAVVAALVDANFHQLARDVEKLLAEEMHRGNQ